MKIIKFILTALIVLNSSFVFSQKYFEWGYANSIQGKEMRKLFAFDESVYIVGKNGMIAKSIDMAAHFTYYYYSESTTLNDIFFTDENTGYVIGENGLILKTINAGESWQSLNSGTTEHLNAIAITNDGNIWIVGNNSTVLKSTDAGSNWQSISLISESVVLNDIAFKESTGYISGGNGTVYNTQDAGQNWEQVHIIENPASDHDMNRISITDSHVFIKVNHKQYYKKIGTEWESKSGDIYLGGLILLDGGTGYYADFRPTTGSGIETFINYTEDYGIEWSYGTIEKKIPNEVNIINFKYHDIFIVSDDLGYAIMNEALLRMPVPDFPSEVSLTQENKIFYSQEDNYLIIRSDEEKIQTVTITDINGISFLSCNNMNKNKIQIPVDKLQPGMYVVNITLSNNNSHSVRWIKN